MIFKYLTHEQRKYQVAAAVVGGAVIGGVASNMAAGTAADAQENAANQSNATQLAMYNQTRADNAPFLASGMAANNALATRLGLNTPVTKSIDQNNPFNSAELNAEVQRVASAQGIDFNSAVQKVAAGWGATPNYTTTGGDASNDPNFGSLLKKFDQNDLNSDVVYNSGLQFGLDQGTQAINRLAAASGSLNSGANEKALVQFGNDYGSMKAGDAYNRYTADNTNIYNKLAGLSGAGQVAANTVDSAGTNAAAGIANTQTALGNARGASAIAGANSINNGVSSISNYYQQNALLKSLQGMNASNNNNYDYNNPVFSVAST